VREFSQLVGYICNFFVLDGLVDISIVCVSNCNYLYGEIGYGNSQSNLVFGGSMDVDDVWASVGWACAFGGVALQYPW